MAAGERVDLFAAVHRGARAALGIAAREVSRADLRVADQLAQADRTIRDCLHRLRGQADHEDHAIQPWIARFSPALAATFAAEHVALEKAAIAAESLLPRLAAAAPAERLAMGAELQRRVSVLVAEQLRHLDREEREGNGVLWANLPDQTLSEIRDRITSRLGARR